MAAFVTNQVTTTFGRKRGGGEGGGFCPPVVTHSRGPKDVNHFSFSTQVIDSVAALARAEFGVGSGQLARYGLGFPKSDTPAVCRLSARNRCLTHTAQVPCFTSNAPVSVQTDYGDCLTRPSSNTWHLVPLATDLFRVPIAGARNCWGKSRRC